MQDRAFVRWFQMVRWIFCLDTSSISRGHVVVWRGQRELAGFAEGCLFYPCLIQNKASIFDESMGVLWLSVAILQTCGSCWGIYWQEKTRPWLSSCSHLCLSHWASWLTHAGSDWFRAIFAGNHSLILLTAYLPANAGDSCRMSLQFLEFHAGVTGFYLWILLFFQCSSTFQFYGQCIKNKTQIQEIIRLINISPKKNIKKTWSIDWSSQFSV